MKELAMTRMRYGCRKIGILLERESLCHSMGMLYRIYREEGLSLGCQPDAGNTSRLPGARFHNFFNLSGFSILSKASKNVCFFKLYFIVDFHSVEFSRRARLKVTYSSTKAETVHDLHNFYQHQFCAEEQGHVVTVGDSIVITDSIKTFSSINDG
ncbi:hypothetical protein [Nitrosovibrio sp. Nv6]|uniref:hypothetical protein n=1 Tax=Nitrosovibrio sp. Nv6 TaxID=1855340 RepID=UPI000B815F9F|nr:hypothetical protein [Nitrosovibrio sp. Nv6]